MGELISKNIEDVIELMDPISLEEMDNVKLMRRRDIKFVLPTRSVPELLMKVKENYRVFEIGGQRIHHYQTLYYDTPEFSMYHEHHGKRLNRYKVRIRKYMTSDISFLEVKFKNNKGETIKKRIRPENPGIIKGVHSETFVKDNSPYKACDIQPSLHNGFKRLTLVHQSNPERVTIDLELNYRPVNSNKDLHLPGLSVIEIKRNRDAEPSDMISQLRSARFRATGFSKYLMGTAMLEPGVKTNLVKNKIRQINKYKNISSV